MKGGAGKRKGGGFERVVAKLLSLWVTGGRLEDVFWRSSMSGGRATIGRGKVRQAGDICAVAPEGTSLVEHFFIECKAYRRLGIPEFLLRGSGPLATFWKVAVRESAKYQRVPMLIARQNGLPAFVIMHRQVLLPFALHSSSKMAQSLIDLPGDLVMFRFDVMLATRCPWQS
jgi:hypothetical protein